MVSTTEETCNGHCMDAAAVHDYLNGANKNGATYCGQMCHEKRYEARCHCGRKYQPLFDASDKQREAAKEYFRAVVNARMQVADAAHRASTQVMIVIRDVDPDIWEGLELPIEQIPGAILRKKFQVSDNDLGISFWRAPLRKANEDGGDSNAHA